MADIIIAYCEPIDTQLVTSKQHFINYLASRGHRILYLENPPTPLSFIKYISYYWRKGLFDFFKLKPIKNNVWSFCGFYPLPYHKAGGGVFDKLWINKWNQLFLRPWIKRAIKKLGFQDPIILLYYPNLMPILEDLHPKRVLMHVVDDWSGMPNTPKSLYTLIMDAIRRADLSVTSAQVLLEKYQPITQNMHLLRHGVDLYLFESVYQKKLVSYKAAHPKQVITVGYYGALHKLDFSLIKKVATEKSQWQFIFYGAIGGLQGIHKTLCDNLPHNIQIQDVIPHADLPHVLEQFDIFWMPFVKNAAMHAMCPIKLFEVAAAGLPAVVTKLEESQTIGTPLHYLFADSVQEHVLQLDNALQEETLEKKKARHDLILDQDWKVISKKFESYLLGFSA